MSRKTIEEIKTSIGLICSATTIRDHTLILEMMQEAQEEIETWHDWPFFGVRAGEIDLVADQAEYSLGDIDSDNIKWTYVTDNLGNPVWQWGIFDSEYGTAANRIIGDVPLYFQFSGMDESGRMVIRLVPAPTQELIDRTTGKLYLDYLRSPRRVDEDESLTLDWPVVFDKVIKWKTISLFAANIQNDTAQGLAAEARAAKMLQDLFNKYQMRFDRAPADTMPRFAGMGGGLNPRSLKRIHDYGG